MSTEDELREALHALENAAQMAKAYVVLVKGLSATLRATVKPLALRATGDEPASEADKAVVDLIGKILDVMDNALEIATKEGDGDDLKHQ